jgi:hypothetical protein
MIYTSLSLDESDELFEGWEPLGPHSVERSKWIIERADKQVLVIGKTTFESADTII